MDEKSLLQQKKKILYLCSHRGSKENELILSKYFVANKDNMSQFELEEYLRLMAESDNDIFDWVSGKVAVPETWLGTVVEKIRSFYNDK